MAHRKAAAAAAGSQRMKALVAKALSLIVSSAAVIFELNGRQAALTTVKWALCIINKWSKRQKERDYPDGLCRRETAIKHKAHRDRLSGYFQIVLAAPGWISAGAESPQAGCDHFQLC